MNASIASDFSSPEHALKSLEDAYVRKDLEAAVAAKDFRFEGIEMLRSDGIKNPDEEMIRLTAHDLELAFRVWIKSHGFPDFAKLACSVVRKTEVRPGLVDMSEVCVFPDGGKSRQDMHAARSAVGWRIVVMPSD